MKAVPEALKAVRKVVTAILEAMKALLRPKGPANQDCQWTRGLSESSESGLSADQRSERIQTVLVTQSLEGCVPKAFASGLSRLDGCTSCTRTLVVRS